MSTFTLNGTTYQTDAETVGVLRSMLMDANQTGYTGVLYAALTLGLHAGRITEVRA